MAKVKLTEEEVASVTSILFKHWGYDVYPEVVLDCFGGRPDLVGVKGKHWVSVVECKVTLSYSLLEQVCRWHMERDYFENNEWYQKNPEPDRTALPNFLWVATGNSRDSKLHSMKRFLLDKYRIGWIDIELSEEIPDGWEEDDHYLFSGVPDKSVCKYSDDSLGNVRIGRKMYSYHVVCDAGIQQGSSRTSHKIVEKLYPEMKQAVSGVKADKANYMTPFKLTLKRVTDGMEEGKSYHPKELLEIVKSQGGHHYAKDSGFTNSVGGWLLKFDLVEKVDYNCYKLKV